MVEISQELKERVNSTPAILAEGLDDKNCMIGGLVEFEFAVIKDGNMRGGFKLILTEASGKYSEKRISTIKSSILCKDAKDFKPFMWKPINFQITKFIKKLTYTPYVSAELAVNGNIEEKN